jgi:hypothetical protein
MVSENIVRIMAVVNPFINILRTKQEALYFKNSQINTSILKGFNYYQTILENTYK